MHACKHQHYTMILCKILNKKVPNEISRVILGFVKDLELVENHKRKLLRCIYEIQEDNDNYIYSELQYKYYDYVDLHEMWRLNDLCFDPTHMEEIVDDIYDYYNENYDALIRRYNREKNCNCCKYCCNKRLYIDRMSHYPHYCNNEFFPEVQWKNYEIICCSTSCNGCLYICSLFYDITYKKLWNSSW